MIRRLSAATFGLALGIFLYVTREWLAYVELGACLIPLVIWGLLVLGYYLLIYDEQEKEE